jgi:predicted metal-binding membrane protein
VAGYAVAWAGFSAVAVALQAALQRSGLLTPMLLGSSAWLNGALLVAAGLWQLSPLKAVCLEHCRSPVGFLTRHWRGGRLGALRMGVVHGAWCIGCCWALMLLLFVGGVMNLAWIALLALLVLVEKTLPGGTRYARLAGVLALLAGIAVLAGV